MWLDGIWLVVCLVWEGGKRLVGVLGWGVRDGLCVWVERAAGRASRATGAGEGWACIPGLSKQIRGKLLRSSLGALRPHGALLESSSKLVG